MNFRWIVTAACGMTAVGLGLWAGGAGAADASSHPPSAKRQLIMCMTKRMSDSRTLSYNDATKLCKEQLQAQRATLAQSVMAKPMAP
jgi:enoyl-CoA hydratase/carnithine racemase